jgi:hypothetical protein
VEVFDPASTQGTHSLTHSISVLSYILSARTTHRKRSLSIVAWHRPQGKHVLHARLRVDLSVSSNGCGSGDMENTTSSVVACWTVFTELLPGNVLNKSLTVLYKILKHSPFAEKLDSVNVY